VTNHYVTNSNVVLASWQVIANTGGVLGLGMTPHEILPRPGRKIVDVDGVPFKGPKTPHAKWHKVRDERWILSTAAVASYMCMLHVGLPLVLVQLQVHGLLYC
jgi:hypothetical protein